MAAKLPKKADVGIAVTTRKLAAVGVAGVATIALTATLAATALSGSGVQPGPWPPAPQNLRVTDVGPDHVAVSFGPSIPGPYTTDPPAADGRSLTIRWTPAIDTLNPNGITYDFYKNGKLVWAGRNQLYAKVGFTRNVRSFTTCVIAHSINGYSPRRCTTWTGQ